MKIEKQVEKHPLIPKLIKKEVVSLDLAKRLQELNVKNDSLFNWVVLDKNHPLYEVHYKTRQQDDLEKLLAGSIIYGRDPYEKSCGEFIHYPAYTVAELGELLPAKYSMSWKISKPLWYCAEDVYDDSISFMAVTEADARAKMLIYLIENNLLKL